VICINGISYTGASGIQPLGTPVTLAAQLDYDPAGSSDGSGIEVDFTYDGNTVSANTIALGSASCQVTLDSGTYTITAKVAVCPCCTFTDSGSVELRAPVGGEWVPIETLQILVRLVGSALALSAIAASFVGFKRIKKKQN
jgi:hypothetical protein